MRWKLSTGDSYSRTREKLRQQLREGKLDDRTVEIDVRERNFPSFEIISNQGVEEMDVNLKDMLPNLFGQRTKKRKMKVNEAFEYLITEEEQRLVDMDQVTRMAIDRVEDAGIIFLDEIDKIAGREGGHGPDVSREGVQRDILPIVEGTTVNTRYGMVRTDHILFIAAGAFHVSKPSDLIPELQGRFPIRVELQSLTMDDFIRILTEPKSSLVKQYTALLETEGVKLEFTKDALEEIARFAFRVNEGTENIGARRLHTIMERVLDEISFSASDKKGEQFKVDAEYVGKMLADIVKDQDLSRYISVALEGRAPRSSHEVAPPISYRSTSLRAPACLPTFRHGSASLNLPRGAQSLRQVRVALTKPLSTGVPSKAKAAHVTGGVAIQVRTRAGWKRFFGRGDECVIRCYRSLRWKVLKNEVCLPGSARKERSRIP